FMLALSCRSPRSVESNVAAPARTGTPRSQDDYPTTDGELALHNLDSQIAGQLERLARTHDLAVHAPLGELLLLRGRQTGRVPDYERAATLAKQLLAAQPKSPVAWRFQASVLSTFHQFSAALAALDKCEANGERPLELESPRAAIAEAQGQYDRALV